MFGVDDLTREEVVTTIVDKVNAAPTTDVTEDEITMAQALAALKSVKPIIPAAATKVTTAVPTLRAKDVTEDEITMAQAWAALKSVKPIIPAAATKVTTAVPTLRAKVPIKNKDQIRMDEEYTRELETKEQKAARLNRAQPDKEANISWDNTQAMMEGDSLLAKRL
nr:hypothetical protein [Tanacetum cinerariifolium]